MIHAHSSLNMASWHVSHAMTKYVFRAYMNGNVQISLGMCALMSIHNTRTYVFFQKKEKKMSIFGQVNLGWSDTWILTIYLSVEK